MALNLSNGFETEYVFHFSLMQATVMSDAHKLLRMKNQNEKEYITGEEKRKDNKNYKSDRLK